jgi:putative salt-induced outer membrane protein
MRTQLFVVIALLATSSAYAQVTPEASPAKPPLAHESEVGIATVSGNSKSETYTAKQTTSYKFDDLNKAAVSARYLRSSAFGIESSRNWDAALRYERTLSHTLAAFVQYGLESDIYAGYVQRNNTDVGLKYDITRTDPTVWFVEAGYRNTVTMSVNKAGTSSTDYSRLYTEASQKIGPQTSLRLWVEYLPSLKDSKDYRLNVEPSLITQLSGIFSLKTSYLMKYQNRPAPPATEHSDKFFTTSLVAKF